MLRFDPWDIAIVAVAAFVAVSALVRMMRWRQKSLMDKLKEEFELEQQRKLQTKRLKQMGQMRRDARAQEQDEAA